MMTRVLFLVLSLCVSCLAISIFVPPAAQMVAEVDGIFIVEFEVNSATPGKAVVKEVLKGPQGIVNSSIVATSPYPRSSFSLERWIVQNGGEPTILLGKWNSSKNELTLIYANSSIWPQGAPDEGSSFQNFSECKKYIINQLERQ